jgi:hypothetical protein
MVTVAPLPTWRDLLNFPAGPAPADAALAAAWRGGATAKEQGARWFSRAAWALPAIVDDWQGSGTAPRFWLPDYFCNGASAPLRQTEAEIRFYPIGDDLEPDWPACREMAAADGVDLFVLVHYFGRASDGARAAEFCQGAGARLIEDAAHVLRPHSAIGMAGDFVLFSPAKLLAVPQGGLLLQGDGPAPGSPGAPAPSTTGWRLRRAVQKCLPGPVLRRRLTRRLPPFDADPDFQASPSAPGLNPHARRLLARAARRMDGMAAARKRNARIWRAAGAWPAGAAPLFSEADEGPAPYRFVLRCAAPDLARRIYERLRGAGVPVETWPDLAPEVLARAEAHGTAIQLRRTLLLLSVHQTLDAEKLLARLPEF